MSNSRTTYAARPDATPESSRVAFATCYQRLIERRRQRAQEKAVEATPEHHGRDGTTFLGDSANERIIPNQP